MRVYKTDQLDVRGLNRLQQAGALPTVWIPPGELRDQRDLPRTRMVLVRQRTQLKNRVHATLAQYALHDVEVTDLFGVRGRRLLRKRLDRLPPHTTKQRRPNSGISPRTPRTSDSGHWVLAAALPA